MPILTWPGKSLSNPAPAVLVPQAYIYPAGCGDHDLIPDNRLFFGDNLGIMAALLTEYEGKVNLIYADPPFFTNRKYNARIGRGEDSRKPNEWRLAEGYHDHWGTLDDYLNFLYVRLTLMHRLLSPTGTFYLHLDWHADAYARLLLDEIFGADNLLNEIIWAYHGPSPIRSAFNRKHDTILACTKGKEYTFNADAVRTPYDESTVKTFAASTKAGFGKVPDLARGKVPEDWWYFPVVARLHNERTGYPTQKPEALLERIILASSNPGDLVADFFCGSGTTPLVAVKHGRRFIASDESFRAIHTTRTRLVREAIVPFTIESENEMWKVEAGDNLFHIQLSKDSVTLNDIPDSFDYWEVDSAWDGKIFKSMAQAYRGVRTEGMAHMLPIRESKTGRRVCVRLVMASGEHYQTIV
jgi:DNA modification methylase